MAAPAPFDPFSLISSGLGVLGSGAGAIVNAAQMPGKKRKYIREARRDALHKIRRNYAESLGYPTGQDGAYQAQQIQRSADENFKIDPMSFVPFVQNATQFAGDLYDAGLDEPETEEEKAERKRERAAREAASQQSVVRRYPIV